MRGLFTIFVLLALCKPVTGQQGFAFTHITVDDGVGLASNLVTSVYQDDKGFIWVGTANGLQRFDGSKFMEINRYKSGTDNLLHSRISQIIPTDSGKLLLASFTLRDFGLFDPVTFDYKKIILKPSQPISPKSEYRLWKDSRGEIYLNVQNYGILHYRREDNSFVDDRPFPFPKGWKIGLLGAYENAVKKQYWFACDSGLCIYDGVSRQMWYKNKNPQRLAILNDKAIQDGITRAYIDKQQRIWIVSLPSRGDGNQRKFCLDSSGSNYLQKDTMGLSDPSRGYVEYKHFFETRRGEFWIYGFNLLLNYDKNSNRFHYNKSAAENNISIDYESVFQIFEDKEGNLWIATNQGLYFTSTGSANSSVVNLSFDVNNGPTAINDILELPNTDLWFASWNAGVVTTNKHLLKISNSVYHQPPPANWSPKLKESVYKTMSLCRQQATGNIWIGCNSGVLMIHNPDKKSTAYLHPAEFENSAISYIVEDKKARIWMATNSGKLIRWSNNTFEVIEDVGTIIYKILIDNDGWIWLATREGGLYAINPDTGKILQHYTANGGRNSLFSNTGTDIEQLRNNLIAFGAGALHLIDKITGQVTMIKYEDGLPSNTVLRLRLDEKGFLWIVTANGLCRYNPDNNRFTPYGRKDGVVLAEQAIATDYCTRNNYMIFGGSNAVIMFNPAIFYTTQKPPDVTITDFTIFDKNVPVDSLMRASQINLTYEQNAVSIYFSTLNYRERDKLSYNYKMEGADKEWRRAERSYFVNYSSLPPGKYKFKIYSENIEGNRSDNTTELAIYIKPPFWRTWWFVSSIMFIVALLIYEVHAMRVNRLLAVETLRNRVARDLHDDMGSTLSTINILSSMAVAKMNVDHVKTSDYLSKISEYSQRMMEVMDDIVWSIKPSNDSMQKISARMREFATNVLEAKEIDFDFKVGEDLHDVKLDMEARRDFFLVFKEAVNNAAKYSQATRLLMEVTMHNKKLVLIVKDNGIGFDIKEADGNGLGNMQKRADNMNGSVSIQSKKGEGTQVKLLIPIL